MTIYLLNYFLLVTPYLVIYLTYKLKHLDLFKILNHVYLIIITIYLYFTDTIDQISLIYGLCSIYVSLFANLYTTRYIVKSHYPIYLDRLINIFSTSMILGFISPNILLFAAFWTIAEIVGFMIISIGSEHSVEGSTRSSETFLFISSLTFELSVFTLIYISLFTISAIITSSVMPQLSILLENFTVLSRYSVEINDALKLILMLGFIGKSALIPIHFWLPEAHTVAPSPASSLLSGVMTAMGVYGLIRISTFIDLRSEIISVILEVLGLITIIYGGLQAVAQRDGKKLLAYSTISSNGFTITLLSYYIQTGSNIALLVSLLNVVAHMAYKTTLFLDMGIIEQSYGYRYIHRLQGYANLAPFAAYGGLLSFASLVGFPPTTGFITKLLAVLTVIGELYNTLSILQLFSTIFYIAISLMIGLHYIRFYFGKPENPNIIVDIEMQRFVLINGLSNILFALILLINPDFNLYMILYGIASILLIIFLYLTLIVVRRG